MPHRFNLFLLGADGKIASRFYVEAATPEEAVHDAQAFAAGQQFELWKDKVLVLRGGPSASAQTGSADRDAQYGCSGTPTIPHR